MRRSIITLLILACAGPAATRAEDLPPTAQSAPSAPRRQLFQDWVLVCATPPGATEESCEINATLQPEAQLPPVGKLAFVRGAKDKTVRLVAIVQANLTIAPGVEVAADPDKKGVILAFKSCLNSACLADAVLSADDVQTFHGLSRSGRLTIRNAGGETLSLQVPFKGLNEALDAMLAQASQ